ncbi:permease [Pseudodesulfovibrio sediminis]|uniref:Permease n=1 Tax=Pseudodesulfovibrio sediminis TaxID=2810563 RepID=A0ABM7P842_9BACT|nr:permease [Pseudodesulfovibrio sediminis]BCS89155.1 permease [Pseudodesulfovibrio sediminis]
MPNTPNNASCDCQSGTCENKGEKKNDQGSLLRYIIFGGLALVAWFVLYEQLMPFADWVSYSVLGLSPESHLGSAVQFFLYDSPKVLMLLVLVVYGVGILRSFVTVNWTRSFLAGRRESAGNVMAALLGVVTPFCSCSAVPLFIGFMTAGIPLGVTFSFLIAAPMVNEIALVLLYGLLGWKVAALYFVTGISIAIVAGWVLGRLGLEDHVEDWVKEIRAGEAAKEAAMSWPERFDYALDSVKDIVGRVWKFVLLGIAVGAAIHGYVPEGQLAGIMGREAWWSVPLSVVMGIPMYTNAAGIIPVVEALLGKGAALGTVLAFMMSVIALSFPEMVILRKVLKPRLIAVFIAVVGSGILVVGYIFNAII